MEPYWTKGSKMVRWWSTKEKNLSAFLAVLKAVPGTFWDWFQKLKPNLDFQRIFDIPLAQCIVSKEFLECIGYISNYLPKSEKSSKKLYGPFLWTGFNCLKVTQPLREDRMKDWVNLGATHWFWTWDSSIGNPAP